MTKTRPKPTLLIFTVGARAESERRRLLPGIRRGTRGAELELHQACFDAALEAGRRAGCRIEVSCPEPLDLAADVRCSPQSGKGFGARLDRALRSSFTGSPGPVVMVGTDVPEMTAEPVRRALDLLGGNDDRVVLGPSPDGGIYLLAASRPIPGLDAGVRWCRRDTLASLRRALERAGREVVLLTPLADLDDASDLERWLRAAGHSAGGRFRSLAVFLRRLLAILLRPPVERSLGKLLGGAPLPVFNRGPPRPFLR